MHRLALLVLTACAASQPTNSVVPAAAPAIPDARFVVVTRDHAYFGTASAIGVTTTTPVPFPQTHAQELAWVAGHDPVVRLGVDNYYGMADEDPPPTDAQWDGRIARLTATGLELYSAIPTAGWPTTKPSNKDYEPLHYDEPWWDMAVTADGAVWQGRCEWGHDFDGGGCTAWFWQRVDQPDGKVVSGELPGVMRDGYAVPKVAPSSRVKLTIAPKHHELAEDEEPPAHVPNRLLCTGAGSRLEYPPLDKVEGGVDPDVVWISTEPPIVRFSVARFGLTVYTEHLVLEGCELSETWKGAELVGGPDGLAALFTDEHGSVRRGGREIGTLRGGARFVRFAPR